MRQHPVRGSRHELDTRIRRAAQLARFTLHDVWGYLDYGDAGAFPALTQFERLEGANIVAAREGTDSSEAIVALAHHNTIRDTPGANDNSASVAALLERARLLGNAVFT
jgi:hypothetical protein